MEMAQQVKTLATKSEDINSIPRYMWKESTDPGYSSFDVHTHTQARAHMRRNWKGEVLCDTSKWEQIVIVVNCGLQ